MINWNLSKVARDCNICKSTNVIYHSNKLENKNHMIISTDTEKNFDKIQHTFMVKQFQETGLRENLSQNSKGNI